MLSHAVALGAGELSPSQQRAHALERRAPALVERHLAGDGAAAARPSLRRHAPGRAEARQTFERRPGCIGSCRPGLADLRPRRNRLSVENRGADRICASLCATVRTRKSGRSGLPKRSRCVAGDGVGLHDRWLQPILRRMLDEVAAGEAASSLLLDSLHESFMLRLARRHSSAPVGHHERNADSLSPHKLRRVLDYIEVHLAEDIRLAELAAVATISSFHFSRAFRLATGVSPYRFVTQRRIECARVLLLTSTDSLETIRLACGFSSRRQFGVLFKKAQHCGPKRFRLRLLPTEGADTRCLVRITASA